MKKVLLDEKNMNRVYDFIKKNDLRVSYIDYPIKKMEYIKKILCQEIENLLPTRLVLSVEENDEILGVCIIEISNWDSEYFGFNCAKLPYLVTLKRGYKKELEIKKKLIQEVRKEIRNKSIKFLTTKISETDISSLHSFEDEGFKISGAYNIYSYDKNQYLNNTISDNYPYEISFSKPSDREDLINIARSRCEISHFWNLPFIDIKKVKGLYAYWVETAFDKKNVKILNIKDNKENVGFVIIRFKDKFKVLTDRKLAELELVVIDRDKKYFSPSLLGKILRLLFEREEIDLIESEVHYKNARAFKYFIEKGFKITRSNYRFNFWR